MKVPHTMGIKAKFVLLTASIAAIFSIAFGIRVIQEEKIHLLRNLEGDGRLLLSSLKAPIINAMILGEMGLVPDLVDNFVEEIVLNPNFTTVYAFIADESGKVLAHNRLKEFGKIYRDPLTLAALEREGFRSEVVHDDRGNILDLALPLRIGGKNWGVLRVGFSMARMEEAFRAFKARIVFFSGGVFLAGAVIFHIIGHTMARPLQQLSEAMTNVDLGALETTPFPPRRDEIGELQNSFQAMLVRLRRSEQERKDALNQVIQGEKMATIGKLVSGVAHEVNNPLAAISACIYTLETKIQKEKGNSLETLKAGVLRIKKIVAQLNDFSRSGNVERQYVQSDEFFQEVKAFANMALKDRDARVLATDECRVSVPLRIDKGKIHQVVLNLLLNAADASPKEGAIELRASADRTSYMLAVTDYGLGIPEENRERIFDLFFTTKSAGLGSGIGLAVCKSIIDLHQGSIDVESKRGKTTFTFTLPLENGVAHG